MSSKIEVCSTLTCGRPFQVNQFAKTSVTQMNPGQIRCPHCGALQAGDPESVFMTHALAAPDEARHMNQPIGKL
jgi:DNA-directed RNA polymerase subunit RPC12/RpoP